MENAFEKYDWSSIKLLDVCGVKASKGHKSKSFGDTGFYQIGIKFTGSTEIFYNGERIMYDDGCVIYLPKEKRADVPYNKTILENGTGVCIFFDSEKELPHKPMRFK
ncbi:MAG: hypothetical protein IJZ20_03640, partial [Clostridia bacterium]|nr:hypothetical protein [Clostridia bacterium]